MIFINKKLKNLLKGIVSISLLVYIISIVEWQQVIKLDIWAGFALIASIVIALILLIFMAIRWKLLLSMQTDHPFPFTVAYRGYLIGLFFNIFMPGAIGGDLARIKYSVDILDIGLKKASFVVATERLFGLTALSIIFSFGLTNNISILAKLDFEFQNVILAMILGITIIIGLKYWLSRHIIIRKSYFLLLVCLSILVQMTDIIIVTMLIWAIGSMIDIMQLFFIIPLVYVATILPISLGGLGVREGVLSGLLVFSGIDLSFAIIIAFMLSLVKICIGIIGGILLNINNKEWQLLNK